jgi:predicted lysophospholipase L1 biosynthesis ABC-type transport system permease subunit
VIAAVRRIFPTSTTMAMEPPDVSNLADVSFLPVALGAVFVVLGLGTVIHALLSTVRRQRHALAVLKSIGFVRGQVRATIAWQASTFAVVALAMGVPLGIAAGRLAWAETASQLAVVSHPVVPLLAVTVGALAFLTVVVGIALVPAELARRIPPAVALRTE